MRDVLHKESSLAGPGNAAHQYPKKLLHDEANYPFYNPSTLIYMTEEEQSKFESAMKELRKQPLQYFKSLPRYIELPTIIYSSTEADIMGKEPDESTLIEVARKVDISRIESYTESIPLSDFREDNKIWTSVNMQSGDNFIVNMTLADFEKSLCSISINVESLQNLDIGEKTSRQS